MSPRQLRANLGPELQCERIFSREPRKSTVRRCRYRDHLKDGADASKPRAEAEFTWWPHLTPLPSERRADQLSNKSQGRTQVARPICALSDAVCTSPGYRPLCF